MLVKLIINKILPLLLVYDIVVTLLSVVGGSVADFCDSVTLSTVK